MVDESGERTLFRQRLALQRLRERMPVSRSVRRPFWAEAVRLPSCCSRNTMMTSLRRRTEVTLSKAGGGPRFPHGSAPASP